MINRGKFILEKVVITIVWEVFGVLHRGVTG